jgi:hypothetical protein
MKTRVLAGALAAGAMCAGASASNLTLTFNGVGPSVNVNYTFGTSTANTSAGVFNWNGSTVKTFCVQLNELISSGQTVTYAVVAPELVPDVPPVSPGNMGAIKATVMRDLFWRFYNTAVTGTATQAAAFQMLVWEISHESIGSATDASGFLALLSLSTGAFKINSSADGNAALSLAISWLNSLGQGGFKAFDGLRGLTHATLQDQLIVVSVPAPALLAGLGLIGAVAVRRRLNKA